jgi:hypothetical protein
MPETAAFSSDEVMLVRQLLLKSLELVNSGDFPNFNLAVGMILEFADKWRSKWGAELPPVSIANQTPAVMRTFLTVEIRGGDPKTQRVCRESIEMEIEHEFMLMRLLHCGRKGVPELILHPFVVES